MTEHSKAVEPGPQEMALVEFGRVFVRRDGENLLNPFFAKVTLEEDKGHINWIKGKYSISSAGYVILNKVASISTILPQCVVVDGKDRPNPQVERNPLTKAIETVNVRKIGIGFSPVGNLVIVDKTLYYNLYTYLLQSFQAKMKKSPGGGAVPQETSPAKAQKPPEAVCAYIGQKEDKPSKDLGGRWTWFIMTEPLGIWVNYEHPDILSCLEEHIQRQRFGERIAQTIVERSILRTHPAIGISQVKPEVNVKDHATAIVKVSGWRHSMSVMAMNEMVARAAKGDTISGEQVSIQAEVVDADLEEEAEAMTDLQPETSAEVGSSKKGAAPDA